MQMQVIITIAEIQGVLDKNTYSSTHLYKSSPLYKNNLHNDQNFCWSPSFTI